MLHYRDSIIRIYTAKYVNPISHSIFLVFSYLQISFQTLNTHTQTHIHTPMCIKLLCLSVFVLIRVLHKRYRQNKPCFPTQTNFCVGSYSTKAALFKNVFNWFAYWKREYPEYGSKLDLGSVMYSLVAITSRSILTQSRWYYQGSISV